MQKPCSREDFVAIFPIRVRSFSTLVSDKLTDWLTDSCLVDLADVNLAVEDSISKLVDIVDVANACVDIEESVEDRLVTADSFATARQVTATAGQQLFNIFLQFPIFFVKTWALNPQVRSVFGNV